MEAAKLSPAEIAVRPVTPAEWPDMQALFDEPGPHRGCWCMYWRVRRIDFNRKYGQGLHAAMAEIIAAGRVPGILAYHEGRPVGWCSVAPRARFPVLDRSPNLKAVDGQPVWSIVCFFIPRQHRRRGLSGHLIRAAVQYALSKGAPAVEAYPIDPRHSASRPGADFTGRLDAFLRAGFTEVARRSPRRPVLRFQS